MRVGLTPTPWIEELRAGSSVAATMNGAADEKSPGTSTVERRQPLDRRHATSRLPRR